MDSKEFLTQQLFLKNIFNLKDLWRFDDLKVTLKIIGMDEHFHEKYDFQSSPEISPRAKISTVQFEVGCFFLPKKNCEKNLGHIVCNIYLY